MECKWELGHSWVVTRKGTTGHCCKWCKRVFLLPPEMQGERWLQQNWECPYCNADLRTKDINDYEVE